MAKKLQWFKTGEEIPDSATYIKTENKIVDWVEVHPMLGDDPVYQEFHLYEVQEPDD